MAARCEAVWKSASSPQCSRQLASSNCKIHSTVAPMFCANAVTHEKKLSWPSPGNPAELGSRGPMAVADCPVPCRCESDWDSLIAWHSTRHPSWTCQTYCSVSARFSARAPKSLTAVAICVVSASCDADWFMLVCQQTATQPSCVCHTNCKVWLWLSAAAPVDWPSGATAVARWFVSDCWEADCVWLVPLQ